MIQIYEDAPMVNLAGKEGFLRMISEMLSNTTEIQEPIYIFGGGLGGGKSKYWEMNREFLLHNFPDPIGDYIEIPNNTYKPNKFYSTPIVSVNSDSLISKLVRKL
jgi:hypothetical protein